MMESTAFFNAKAQTSEVSLFLDVDPKKDIIKDFFYDGPESSRYKIELEELKHQVLGKSLEEARHFLRSELLFESSLESGEKAIASMGIWLLREAISSYMGEGRFFKEDSDLICLCFAVTKRDIVKKVLADKDFNLKILLRDTKASSACGTCRGPIEKIIQDTRNQHGKILGLDHAKSRFDKDGKWIKVAGMYPGPLLLKLEELKNEWMAREGIVNQFEIEIASIEGFHLELKVNSSNEKTVAGLLSALTDFYKSKLGVLFFLRAL